MTATRSRKAKIEALASCLRAAGPHEVEAAVALLAGRLPTGRIGVGYRGVQDALRATEPALDPELELAELVSALERIAATRGSGSATLRATTLADLLSRSTEAERDFLARLLVGELRQGALEGIGAEAIAQAAEVPAAAVRRARMFAGDLGPVAAAALEAGSAGLSRFAPSVFQAVEPMLAQPVDDVASALEALGEAAFEWKLDGARVQVHRVGDDVRVFTRGLRDVTAAVPELVACVRALPVRQVILDGEAIALRPDGRPHPFQTTMRRFGRKRADEELRARLPLRGFFFDCLWLDGESLLERPTAERLAALEETLPESLALPRRVTSDPSAAQAFFDTALAWGHEGLMAKALDAPYAAGARGRQWLKLKHAHTLDLVVLAAEWGHGRRKGWLSNLHLGACDPAHGGFAMLGKTFKGLTDAMLRWQTEKLLALEISRDDWTVHVRPELVVEIAFSDVQSSPHYPSGLALRFARVKGYRTDKSAAGADTLDAVRDLWTR